MSPRAQDIAWRRFIETGARLQTVLDEELKADAAITLSDYNILLMLTEAPGHRIRMRDLADRMVFSSSRLSYQIDTMTRRGWICRERATEDRRGSYAVLTAHGRAAFADAARGHGECIEALFGSVITDDEAATLIGIMDKIRDRLEDNNHDRTGSEHSGVDAHHPGR